LTARFHYHLDRSKPTRTALPINPLSSTSARGKLVAWGSTVLALIYQGSDLIVLDLKTLEILGRVPGAGGPGSQEVLYDVSWRDTCDLYLRRLTKQRYRSDVLSIYVGIEQESKVVDISLSV
jgi:hypothetical protein